MNSKEPLVYSHFTIAPYARSYVFFYQKDDIYWNDRVYLVTPSGEARLLDKPWKILTALRNGGCWVEAKFTGSRLRLPYEALRLAFCRRASQETPATKELGAVYFHSKREDITV